jgi:hypothetical protein
MFIKLLLRYDAYKAQNRTYLSEFYKTLKLIDVLSGEEHRLR